MWSGQHKTTTLHLTIFSWTCRCSKSCVLHIHGPVKKQPTMIRSQINWTHPNYSMKAPNLQPLSLLCFTDVLYPLSVPHQVILEAMGPSLHPTSCTAISIFQSWCKLVRGHLLINQPMPASCCCCYYSTCIHRKWRVSKNVLTFLRPFFVSWFYFSVHYYIPVHAKADISGPSLN